MPQPYRVFISYSHSESKFLNAVRKHLEETIACNVRCSLTLRPGTGFSQQIKDEISRAHLFIPIVTPKANKRGWVHQEIGFAMAMNVPILPLAIGQLPQGMAQGLQAISLDEDLTGLAEKLTSSLIETHVTLITAEDKAMYCRAEFQEDRTRLLIDAAYKVLHEVPWEDARLDGTLEPFRVRQAGALSSFSLPDKPYYDNVWRFVDGQGQRRSNALCRDLQIERLRLERLARIGGCDLIVSPNIHYAQRGEQALGERLKILIDFIKKSAGDNLRIIVMDEELPGNLLLLGDWFLAESTTPLPGFGYVETLGTWHAPTVLRRQIEFDLEFKRLSHEQNLSSPADYQRAACSKLQNRIKDIARRTTRKASRTTRRIRP